MKKMQIVLLYILRFLTYFSLGLLLTITSDANALIQVAILFLIVCYILRPQYSIEDNLTTLATKRKVGNMDYLLRLIVNFSFILLVMYGFYQLVLFNLAVDLLIKLVNGRSLLELLWRDDVEVSKENNEIKV